MKKGVIIGLVVGVVLIIAVVIFLISVGNRESPPSQLNSNEMMDCGMMDNPGCFLSRMNECLPVTGWFMSEENKVVMIVLGVENNTCHFQRNINDVLNMNCYFPEGILNGDILAQTLGDDKGLQSVVDEACKNI